MAIKSSDQITVLDLTDGYSVTLTSDGYTFPGTTNAAKAGSCTTQIIAMRGTEQIAAAVTVANCTKPTGISITSDNDGTAPTLTISASTNFTTAGVVKIPVTLEDGTITLNKVFSVGIAFTGAQGVQGAKGDKGETGSTGNGISAMTITYQAGTSNTTAPTGTWASTPPSVAENSYLWTKMVVTYTNGSTSDPVYTVAKQGAKGATGTAGGKWYSGTGITGTSTTATVFSGSGVSSAVVGDMYLNTSTQNTYRCTTAGAASAAKWVYVSNIKGQTGAAGADAITMKITSSNGFIFKNSGVSTTLTAHVYKAGAELTATQIAALGTIKWYKDGSTTALSTTGATLSLDADDVDNKATYTAQLEA